MWWNYSGMVSFSYGVSGIVPIRRVLVHLPEGVTFLARVEALPLTDEDRHDLDWGFMPKRLEEIVNFAAQEFCHRAPWGRA